MASCIHKCASMSRLVFNVRELEPCGQKKCTGHFSVQDISSKYGRKTEATLVEVGGGAGAARACAPRDCPKHTKGPQGSPEF